MLSPAIASRVIVRWLGSPEKEPLVLAASNPVLFAADANRARFEVAVNYAFAKGREAAGGEANSAVAALRTALLAVLPPVLRATFLAGAESFSPVELRAAAPAPKKPLKFKFDPRNQAAITWVKKHALELADDLSETSRKNITAALAASFEGLGKRELTKVIRANVGDKSRAELIARTETMKAASEGQRASWRDAVEEGYLSGKEKRVWIATEDCCDECDDLDGELAGLDGSYADGIDGPPLHPRCRCAEGLSE